MADPSPITCVVLDVVGTILKPRRPVAEVYQEVGGTAGSRKTVPEVRARFANAFQTHFGKEYGRSITGEEEEVQRWRRVVYEVFDDLYQPEGVLQELWDYFGMPEAWSPYDDALTFALQIKSRLHLAIASNFDRRLVGILDGLSVPFDSLHYSSELGAAKPNLKFFSQVRQRLGFATEQMLMIGDDPTNDVAGARQAGWKSVWLDRTAQPQSHENARAVEIPTTIQTFADLTPWLDAIALPRFVLLHHHMPATSTRNSHWDFMLEDGSTLATWAVPSFPANGQYAMESIERLADHRKDYLEYEGEVSNNRGHVKRVEEGTFRWLCRTNDLVKVELNGNRLSGVVSLSQEKGQWIWQSDLS